MTTLYSEVSPRTEKIARYLARDHCAGESIFPYVSKAEAEERNWTMFVQEAQRLDTMMGQLNVAAETSSASANRKNRPSFSTLKNAAIYSSYARPAITILREDMKCDIIHEENHITRVVRNAIWFADGQGDLDIIIPAAILHDLVNVPKNSPDRSRASQLSAERAISRMAQLCGFKSNEQLSGIGHAIEAHSWSANIEPTTWEAKVVQDADRIDSLGHLGLARLLAIGGNLNRQLLHYGDPKAETRDLDEVTYTLDHYFVKVQHLVGTMKTPLGQQEAKRLHQKMESFIEGLIDEL